MSSKKFQEEVRSCDGAGITREVYLSGEKYILFTRLPQDGDVWVVGVTDGRSIWTVELTEEILNERRGTSTLKEISDALRNGDFQLFSETPKLSLTVLRKFNWSLEHPTDTQFKTEMNLLLFSLFDKLQSTTVKLQECENALSRAKSAATAAAAGGLGDLVSSGSSGKTAASKQKRIKGASIVNPSSKRLSRFKRMNHGNILMHSSGRAKKRFDDMCGAQQFVAGYTAQELRISASGWQTEVTRPTELVKLLMPSCHNQLPSCQSSASRSMSPHPTSPRPTSPDSIPVCWYILPRSMVLENYALVVQDLQLLFELRDVYEEINVQCYDMSKQSGTRCLNVF